MCSKRVVDRALLLQHNRTSVLSHLDPERELVLHNLLLPQQEADPDLQSSPSSEGGGRLHGLSTLSVFGLSADLYSYS